ncbi:hypothetical protein ABID42_002555 [Arcicella rosea]|uniref:hypothetical protein n=1 Tax=Arcicella rosea TaxID=502909 RepID=UPI00345C771A
MSSIIRQRYPLLADELNLVFAKLKGKEGFWGIDLVAESQDIKIRVIVSGNNNDTTEENKKNLANLLDSQKYIVWKLMPMIHFNKTVNFPKENPNQSKVFSVIQPCINIGDGHNRGTLGLICIDVTTNKVSLLTAHHVVSNGQFVIQPSDKSNIVFAIARFKRYDPNGDAALCELIVPQLNQIFAKRQIVNNIIAFKNELFETNIIIQDVRYPVLGEKVTKIGLATGKTDAIVRGIGIYKHSQDHIIEGRIAWVEGCWLEPEDIQNKNDLEISFQGDSGAVWFDSTQKFGIGLQIAGDFNESLPTQEFAIAQHLPDIMETLQIKPFI